MITLEPIIYTYVTLVGLAVGSFLNVYIYRSPYELSIVFPGSHCMKCNNALKWYHNIPVVSFIFLKGRCGFCSTKLSLRYPLIEILTSVSFIATYHKFSEHGYLTVIVYCIFMAAMIAGSAIDIDHKILPDAITIGGTLIALCISPFLPLIQWNLSILGAVIGFFALFIPGVVAEMILKKEALGFGDVKLMALFGALMGPACILPTMFIGSVAGLIGALGYKLFKVELENGEIPFGPYLAIGAVSYLFYGEEISRLLF